MITLVIVYLLFSEAILGTVASLGGIVSISIAIYIHMALQLHLIKYDIDTLTATEICNINNSF